MAENYLTEDEVISGQEGSVILTIGGSVIEAAEIKKLEATIEKTKSAFKVLGFRGEQNKATGFRGTGTMTMYYNTTRWAKLMEDYVKKGVDTFFSILVINDDPSTTVGSQRVRLNRCNIDNLIIAAVDADTEFLTRDVNFTFGDYDILDSFTN